MNNHMWKHYCASEAAFMSFEVGCECDWCGAVDNSVELKPVVYAYQLKTPLTLTE